MKIDEILIEAGLALGALRKHGGKYFDTLVSKIQNGETFEVEPSVSREFPDGVIIDPKMAPLLLKAFYPNGNKEEMVTNASGFVEVVDPKILRTPLKIANSNKTIAFGLLTKTKEFKGGRGINIGIIAEGVLGAALTAKFIKKGADINTDDIRKIISKMVIKPETGPKKTESIVGLYSGYISHTGGSKDNIKFLLKLSSSNFKFLKEELTSKQTTQADIKSVILSAILYVNSEQQGISRAIKTVVEKTDKNLIEVTTDGISDNKGTKADLTLRVNGKVVKLISLKAMSSSQFGQVGGSKFENFETFVNELFDIDISKHAKKFKIETDAEDKKYNHELMTVIYQKDIGPAIKKQLSGGSKSEAMFIERMANGIIKHATLDKDVDIVKFDRSVYGGVKVLKVDRKSLSELNKIKFTVKVIPGSSKLEIYGSTTDPKLLKKLGSGEELMLVKLRSYYQAKTQYVRNVFEMGPLLEELTTVDKVAGDRPTTRAAVAAAAQKAKDIAVGKITKKGERDVRAKSVPDIVALGRKKKR